MNYAELVTAIEDTTENTFTAVQVKTFIQQTEQTILNSVEIPAQRKSSAGTTSAGNPFFSLPSDYLYSYSLQIQSNNTITFLLPKDDNFIAEAFPSTLTSDRGIPTHYSQVSDDSLRLGPTPDTGYQVTLNYAAYPTSIAGDNKSATTTSWLGDNFDSALLSGALVEAARFMKADPDIVAMYDKMFVNSMQLLKNMGDGKLRGDVYRNGQPKSQVL